VNLELILGVVFGGGTATLIATVYKVVDGRRRGRIESEDSIITRLENENRKARARADEAEEDAERYLKEARQSEAKAARFEVTLIRNGIDVPEFPSPTARHLDGNQS
jgi:hypothetical protein